MKKRIVILGAGIGGVIVATELAKALGSQHEIIIVDQEEYYHFSPSFVWMIVGKRELPQISVPIKKIERRGIRFMQGRVEQIDVVNKVVRVSGVEVVADVLVVALGAVTHMEGLSSLEQHGHNLYSAAGAQAICDTRKSAQGKQLAVVVCSMPFKCPAAPYEAAMLLQADLGAAKTNTAVSIYSPEPGPMPVAGEAVSKKVVELLDHKGIAYFPKHVVNNDSTANSLLFQDGKSEHYDYLVYVPKHKVPDVLVECGLAQAGGWVPVDMHTMASKYPDVYVLGDSAGIPLKNGKSLPKAGVFAHSQAKVVAHNIAAKLAGQNADARFNGHGSCFIEMGKGMASKGAGNFYAEPDPQVGVAFPTPFNHWGKVIFEKYWLNLIY